MTKKAAPGEIVYSELSKDIPIDAIYQFYVIRPLVNSSCKLTVEIYLKAGSLLKKILLSLVIKKAIRNAAKTSLDNLKAFVDKEFNDN